MRLNKNTCRVLTVSRVIATDCTALEVRQLVLDKSCEKIYAVSGVRKMNTSQYNQAATVNCQTRMDKEGYNQ